MTNIQQSSTTNIRRCSRQEPSAAHDGSVRGHQRQGYGLSLPHHLSLPQSVSDLHLSAQLLPLTLCQEPSRGEAQHSRGTLHHVKPLALEPGAPPLLNGRCSGTELRRPVSHERRAKRRLNPRCRAMHPSLHPCQQQKLTHVQPVTTDEIPAPSGLNDGRTPMDEPPHSSPSQKAPGHCLDADLAPQHRSDVGPHDETAAERVEPDEGDAVAVHALASDDGATPRLDAHDSASHVDKHPVDSMAAPGVLDSQRTPPTTRPQ
jgi:hypothetical protein